MLSESIRKVKVLVFMCLRWLSFNKVEGDVFWICLRFKVLHNSERFDVWEWVRVGLGLAAGDAYSFSGDYVQGVVFHGFRFF